MASDTRIVARFDAITAPMEAKIARLEAQLTKLNNKSKEQGDTLAASFDKHAKSIATVAKRIAVVTGAVYVATASIDAYLKKTELQAASAGSSLEKMRKASQGLATDTDLMGLAAKTMKGTWKLNQDQQDIVLKGALALRKQFGVALPEAM